MPKQNDDRPPDSTDSCELFATSSNDLSIQWCNAIGLCSELKSLLDSGMREVQHTWAIIDRGKRSISVISMSDFEIYPGPIDLLRSDDVPTAIGINPYSDFLLDSLFTERISQIVLLSKENFQERDLLVPPMDRSECYLHYLLANDRGEFDKSLKLADTRKVKKYDKNNYFSCIKDVSATTNVIISNNIDNSLQCKNVKDNINNKFTLQKKSNLLNICYSANLAKSLGNISISSPFPPQPKCFLNFSRRDVADKSSYLVMKCLCSSKKDQPLYRVLKQNNASPIKCIGALTSDVSSEENDQCDQALLDTAFHSYNKEDIWDRNNSQIRGDTSTEFIDSAKGMPIESYVNPEPGVQDLQVKDNVKTLNETSSGKTYSCESETSLLANHPSIVKRANYDNLQSSKTYKTPEEEDHGCSDQCHHVHHCATHQNRCKHSYMQDGVLCASIQTEGTTSTDNQSNTEGVLVSRAPCETHSTQTSTTTLSYETARTELNTIKWKPIQNMALIKKANLADDSAESVLNEEEVISEKKEKLLVAFVPELNCVKEVVSACATTDIDNSSKSKSNVGLTSPRDTCDEAQGDVKTEDTEIKIDDEVNCLSPTESVLPGSNRAKISSECVSLMSDESIVEEPRRGASLSSLVKRKLPTVTEIEIKGDQEQAQTDLVGVPHESVGDQKTEQNASDSNYFLVSYENKLLDCLNPVDADDFKSLSKESVAIGTKKKRPKVRHSCYMFNSLQINSPYSPLLGTVTRTRKDDDLLKQPQKPEWDNSTNIHFDDKKTKKKQPVEPKRKYPIEQNTALTEHTTVTEISYASAVVRKTTNQTNKSKCQRYTLSFNRDKSPMERNEDPVKLKKNITKFLRGVEVEASNKSGKPVRESMNIREVAECMSSETTIATDEKSVDMRYQESLFENGSIYTNPSSKWSYKPNFVTEDIAIDPPYFGPKSSRVTQDGRVEYRFDIERPNFKNTKTINNKLLKSRRANMKPKTELNNKNATFDVNLSKTDLPDEVKIKFAEKDRVGQGKVSKSDNPRKPKVSSSVDGSSSPLNTEKNGRAMRNASGQHRKLKNQDIRKRRRVKQLKNNSFREYRRDTRGTGSSSKQIRLHKASGQVKCRGVKKTFKRNVNNNNVASNQIKFRSPPIETVKQNIQKVQTAQTKHPEKKLEPKKETSESSICTCSTEKCCSLSTSSVCTCPSEVQENPIKPLNESGLLRKYKPESTELKPVPLRKKYEIDVKDKPTGHKQFDISKLPSPPAPVDLTTRTGECSVSVIKEKKASIGPLTKNISAPIIKVDFASSFRRAGKRYKAVDKATLYDTSKELSSKLKIIHSPFTKSAKLEINDDSQHVSSSQEIKAMKEVDTQQVVMQDESHDDGLIETENAGTRDSSRRKEKNVRPSPVQPVENTDQHFADEQSDVPDVLHSVNRNNEQLIINENEHSEPKDSSNKPPQKACRCSKNMDLNSGRCACPHPKNEAQSKITPQPKSLTDRKTNKGDFQSEDKIECPEDSTKDHQHIWSSENAEAKYQGVMKITPSVDSQKVVQAPGKYIISTPDFEGNTSDNIIPSEMDSSSSRLEITRAEQPFDDRGKRELDEGHSQNVVGESSDCIPVMRTGGTHKVLKTKSDNEESQVVLPNVSHLNELVENSSSVIPVSEAKANHKLNPEPETPFKLSDVTVDGGQAIQREISSNVTDAQLVTPSDGNDRNAGESQSLVVSQTTTTFNNEFSAKQKRAADKRQKSHDQLIFNESFPSGESQKVVGSSTRTFLPQTDNNDESSNAFNHSVPQQMVYSNQSGQKVTSTPFDQYDSQKIESTPVQYTPTVVRGNRFESFCQCGKDGSHEMRRSEHGVLKVGASHENVPDVPSHQYFQDFDSSQKIAKEDEKKCKCDNCVCNLHAKPVQFSVDGEKEAESNKKIVVIDHKEPEHEPEQETSQSENSKTKTVYVRCDCCKCGRLDSKSSSISSRKSVTITESTVKEGRRASSTGASYEEGSNAQKLHSSKAFQIAAKIFGFPHHDDTSRTWNLPVKPSKSFSSEHRPSEARGSRVHRRYNCGCLDMPNERHPSHMSVGMGEDAHENAHAYYYYTNQGTPNFCSDGSSTPKTIEDINSFDTSDRSHATAKCDVGDARPIMHSSSGDVKCMNCSHKSDQCKCHSICKHDSLKSDNYWNESLSNCDETTNKLVNDDAYFKPVNKWQDEPSVEDVMYERFQEKKKYFLSLSQDLENLRKNRSGPKKIDNINELLNHPSKCGPTEGINMQKHLKECSSRKIRKAEKDHGLVKEVQKKQKNALKLRNLQRETNAYTCLSSIVCMNECKADKDKKPLSQGTIDAYRCTLQELTDKLNDQMNMIKYTLKEDFLHSVKKPDKKRRSEKKHKTVQSCKGEKL